jgi:hypothetical protein
MGSDDGLQQSELRGFSTLSIVWYSKEHRITQRFGNWICFLPHVKGWETPTLLVPSERDYPNRWNE